MIYIDISNNQTNKISNYKLNVLIKSRTATGGSQGQILSTILSNSI